LGYISAAQVPQLSDFSDEQRRLIAEIKGSNEEELSESLQIRKKPEDGAIPVQIEAPETDASIPADDIMRAASSSSYAKADLRLKKKIINICDKHKEAGWNHYFSGRYSMNGHNYAKDIVWAAEYVCSLLSDEDDLSISTVVQLIDSKRGEYEKIYTDLEGFGGGTLAAIINDIEALREG